MVSQGNARRYGTAMVRPQGVDEIEFNARSGINYQDVSGWVVVMHSRHVAQAVDTQGVW
jgi:hypothetical protein